MIPDLLKLKKAFNEYKTQAVAFLIEPGTAIDNEVRIKSAIIDIEGAIAELEKAHKRIGKINGKEKEEK
jgi:hypothetical protein